MVYHVLVEHLGDSDHGVPFQAFADRAMAELEAAVISARIAKGELTGFCGCPIKVVEVPVWPEPICDEDYV